MATVSKQIADRIIAGEFKEDKIVKIVKYNNHFDGAECYGTVNAYGDYYAYENSPFVHNCTTYWEKPL